MLLGLATPIRVSLDRFELLINVGKLLFQKVAPTRSVHHCLLSHPFCVDSTN